jgi:hypothetical protein
MKARNDNARNIVLEASDAQWATKPKEKENINHSDI